MRRNNAARSCVSLAVALLAFLLVGCTSNPATRIVASKSPGEIYTSQALNTSYPGALNAYRQLMLGTLRLEGTGNAITSEQAKTLLVLWQALAGRVLQSDAEREAVLAYIETQMTPAQLQAVAVMRLTQDDLQALITDTRQEPGGLGRGMPQAGAGQPGAVGTPFVPGERVTPQAMITRPAPSGRVTLEAGSVTRGTSNPSGAEAAQDTVLLNSVIRLLSQRAAEGRAAPTKP